MWPFPRRRAREAPAPAPADGWRDAPAMPRTLGAAEGTFGTVDFESGLVTRRPPTFVEGLAHDITEDGPSGVIAGLLEPTWSAGAAGVGDRRRTAATHLQRFPTHPLRAPAGQTMSFGGPVDEVGVRELPAIDEPAEAVPPLPALTVAPPVPVTAAPEVPVPMDAAVELSPEVEPGPDGGAVSGKVRPLGLGPPIASLQGLPVPRATSPAPRSPAPHGLSGPAVVQRRPVGPDERVPVLRETPPDVTGQDTIVSAESASVPESPPTPAPTGEQATTPASRPVPTTVAPASVRSPTLLQRTETGVAAAPPAPAAGPVLTTAAAVPQSAPPATLQRIARGEGPAPSASEAPPLPPTPVTTPPPTPEALSLPPTAVTPPPPVLATHRQVDVVPTLEPTVLSGAAATDLPHVQTLPTASVARQVATTTASRRDQRLAADHGVPPRVHAQPLPSAGPGFSEPSGAQSDTAAPRRAAGAARRPVGWTEAVDPSPTVGPAVVGGATVLPRAHLIAQRTLRPAGPHTATASPPVTSLSPPATARPPWKQITPPVRVGGRAATGSLTPKALTPLTPVAAGDSGWPHPPALAPASVVQRRALGDFAPLLGGWSRPPDQQHEEPAVDDLSTEPMAVASPARDRPARSFLDIAAAATPLAAQFLPGLTTLGPDGSTDFARDAAAPLPTWTTVQPATGAPVASGAGGGGSGLAAVDTRSLTTEQLDELARRLYDKIRDRLRAELRIDRERRGRVTDLVE